MMKIPTKQQKEAVDKAYNALYHCMQYIQSGQSRMDEILREEKREAKTVFAAKALIVRSAFDDRDSNASVLCYHRESLVKAALLAARFEADLKRTNEAVEQQSWDRFLKAVPAAVEAHKQYITQLLYNIK